MKSERRRNKSPEQLIKIAKKNRKTVSTSSKKSKNTNKVIKQTVTTTDITVSLKLNLNLDLFKSLPKPNLWSF